MNLNGGILGKVSVVDRGKALVYRGQSQKLSLACSVGKKKKKWGQGYQCLGTFPCLEDTGKKG